MLQGDLQVIVATVERAAARGDAEALLTLAKWRLVGTPLGRNLPEARRLFALARQAGNWTGSLIETMLTANGTGAPADWRGALSLLRQAAEQDEVAAHQFALVNAMAIDADGSPCHPPSGERLAPDCTVVRFAKFLTRAECQHIADTAVDLLAPTTVVDPVTGRQIPHPIRTSDAAVIGPMRETLVVQAINRRIAIASNTKDAQGEALSVLRYTPGQQYKSHLDVLPGTRNQRTKTVLVYLNDGFSGGETTFPAYNLVITPRAGDAVIFTNTLADGSVDRRAIHTGEPVRRGTKWLATRWIRERPFSPWTGPEVA